MALFGTYAKGELTLEYRIGICDEDYHYVVNLMEYINSHRIGGLKLVAFSSLQAVVEYLEKNYLDGLLVGQVRGDTKPYIDEILEGHNGIILIPISVDMTADEGYLYKYQSAQAIASYILDRLNVSLVPQSVQDKAFYAVYSPIGRCGKTSLAKGLSIRYRGALYVALEEFGTREGLSEDILYHIVCENTRLHSLMEKLKPNEYGFREIKGILSYMDIRQLSKDNFQWFKEQLLIGGNYDKVIFDIGGAVLSDLNILQVMDRIYVPVIEEEEAMEKLQAFKELLRNNNYVELGNKLQFLKVPKCHYSSDMMLDFIGEGEL